MTDTLPDETGDSPQGPIYKAKTGAGTSTPPSSDPDDPHLWSKEDGKRGACPGEDVQPPYSEYLELQIARAKADAVKPIIPEKLYFANPATEPERAAADKAYETAARKADPAKKVDDGPLRKRFVEAEAAFKNIAEDLLRTRPDGKTHLAAWIETYLAPDKSLMRIFAGRQEVEFTTTKRSGPRACRYERAEAKAKALAARYGEWSKAIENIAKIVESNLAKMSTLSCEIHALNPRAIYEFWFDVAPRHLGLRDGKTLASNTPGIKDISAALAALPARRRAYLTGAQKNDGSLYLFDPAARTLEAQRVAVLDKWRHALEDQGTLKALLDERPDDQAALKKRLDDLIREEAEAKKLFGTVPA
jgi:hypothetical protein